MTLKEMIGISTQKRRLLIFPWWEWNYYGSSDYPCVPDPVLGSWHFPSRFWSSRIPWGGGGTKIISTMHKRKPKCEGMECLAQGHRSVSGKPKGGTQAIRHKSFLLTTASHHIIKALFWISVLIQGSSGCGKDQKVELALNLDRVGGYLYVSIDPEQRVWRGTQR